MLGEFGMTPQELIDAIDEQQAAFTDKNNPPAADVRDERQPGIVPFRGKRLVIGLGNLSVQEQLAIDEWWNL